jgi:hypothetical protein
MSVVVDATPTSRIVSIFCKHVKVNGQSSETTLDLKNDALNSAPLPSHPPEIERSQ